MMWNFRYCEKAVCVANERCFQCKHNHLLLWLQFVPFWTSPVVWWEGRRHSGPAQGNITMTLLPSHTNLYKQVTSSSIIRSASCEPSQTGNAAFFRWGVRRKRMKRWRLDWVMSLPVWERRKEMWWKMQNTQGHVGISVSGKNRNKKRQTGSESKILGSFASKQTRKLKQTEFCWVVLPWKSGNSSSYWHEGSER